ncbi:hypothetical protein H8356DRAFT_1089835 [Neocallimastix lanati (nom. inval.)]|uniref:Uncharacterized protein n=1 Tax=Neocallimastix californiae TaxID=1754190 RepID=A0A1Y1XY60_9FUNG|nr:hypothetical protein H8356DRAFT_1089835 [Neocallimastix sp. JGI-2020a]ORX90683.1 hypothetical protein LY90DRAFT_520921 [Neocallimastix californiae]|eukprot:ORX90683.1 hypothetical protein LY90DRAFT_520921 [Neocallimastix californiae]
MNEYLYNNFKGDICTHAKCSIKFKGDKSDKNCKNSYTILDYVTKQRKELDVEDWKIDSCFDWEKRLEEYERKYKIDKPDKTKLTELEMPFCSWLCELIINNSSMTKNEIRREILKHEDFSFIYMSKNLNYENLLSRYFKENPSLKPPAYWGLFWIPCELKEAMDYLNNWVKDWFGKNILRMGVDLDPSFYQEMAIVEKQV